MKTTLLMTVAEVANRLKCSESFVYQLLSSGELKHYGLGQGQGAKRISEEQLEEYLAAKERGGPKPTPVPRVTLKHLRG